MQGHKGRIKRVIAGFIIAGVGLLSFPTAAQQSGPQSKQGTVSDDDLIKLHQQIKELKNPKMIQTLGQAKAFRLLGEYYGANQDKVKSKEAFTQSAKLLKSVDNSNEKVRTSLLLAESVLKYEPADAYEVFRESVKAINNLPSPEKDQEKMYYLNLLPIAEDLIRSFRLLATRENQTATSLAAEIKLSELRLSALSGVYSGHEVIADKKSNQE